MLRVAILATLSAVILQKAAIENSALLKGHTILSLIEMPDSLL